VVVAWLLPWGLPEVHAAGPRTAAAVVSGVQASAPHAAPADPVAPDRPTPEMVAWARARVPARGTDDAIVDALLDALSDRFRAEHERGGPPGGTGTASEVFATGRYNCLSLALLVVPLARELGVDAHYVRIRDLRTPVDLGGTVVVAGHVAAAVGAPGRARVVDPVPATDDERRVAVSIPDAEAVALYHVNRGAEATLAGAPAEALAWFDLADEVWPDLPETWVDRGVALARSGRASDALDAWRAAVAVDPWHGPAWRNLARALAAAGDPEGARATLTALSGEVRRDPHTRLALGDAWAQVGELDRARRAYRGAAFAGGASAAVRAARGELALASGDPGRAARWLRRAERVDPSHPRVATLRRRLPPAGGSG
jgi:Flp pilus assembly protein TadD